MRTKKPWNHETKHKGKSGRHRKKTLNTLKMFSDIRDGQQWKHARRICPKGRGRRAPVEFRWLQRTQSDSASNLKLTTQEHQARVSTNNADGTELLKLAISRANGDERFHSNVFPLPWAAKPAKSTTHLSIATRCAFPETGERMTNALTAWRHPRWRASSLLQQSESTPCRLQDKSCFL